MQSPSAMAVSLGKVPPGRVKLDFKSAFIYDLSVAAGQLPAYLAARNST